MPTLGCVICGILYLYFDIISWGWLKTPLLLPLVFYYIYIPVILFYCSHNPVNIAQLRIMNYYTCTPKTSILPSCTVQTLHNLLSFFRSFHSFIFAYKKTFGIIYFLKIAYSIEYNKLVLSVTQSVPYRVSQITYQKVTYK